jgi:uncharacterized protein involved in outer membrane biogenesis
MTPARYLKWTAGICLAPALLALVFIAIFGWNWMRGPIERLTTEKTGRALVINGELTVKFGWPLPRIQAKAVTFANPLWASEKQMVAADAVEITIDLPQLLLRNIVFTEVRLERPVVFLEQGSGGKKSWLLDRDQQDENAHVRIGRLTLDHGTLGYDDAANKTSIRSELSSTGSEPGATSGPGVTFSATGHYQGLPLKASGSGGPVLALRDDSTPYPLKVDLAVGHTRVRADGSVAGLLKFTSVDLRLALSGDNLEQLFPLLGIAVPATRSYATEGHLLHAANSWRYEKFSGRLGESDIAGSLRLVTGGPRPVLTAELASKMLDLDDLGPMIGSRPASPAPAIGQPAKLPAASGRVLPDLPFKTDRWSSVDADVKWLAKTIRRAKELPLEEFSTHLNLRDSVLTLDPLSFGIAGGHLNAVIALDGRQDPIQAHARVKAKRILIGQLFPTIELNKTSIGQVNGEFDLTGKGNSVARMLASANGKVGLVVSGGEISKLMMEKVGLHLWEILALNLTGDKLIKLRCAVAEFDVKEGIMQADALIFDTEITTIIGTGSIDLRQEQLDLTLNQKTKNTSPLALRSPIYVRGSFANPVAGVDKTRMATRALGAIALGMVNPILALMPLIDAGPGKDSDCVQLVRDARAMPKLDGTKTAAPK